MKCEYSFVKPSLLITENKIGIILSHWRGTRFAMELILSKEFEYIKEIGLNP